jgi:HSP20 family molecular chaperone IbpA
MDDDWSYCPRCGAKKEGDFFENIFTRFRKEFEEMSKLFERDFEAFDLSPVFKNRKSSGFSIKITTSGDGKPIVSVKTFGDVDKNKLKKQIEQQLGLKGRVEELPEKPKVKERVIESYTTPPVRESTLRAPKITEEPETEIKRVGDKVVVEMDIPGVDNMENIEITELENSVEVKAIAGEKAFFKIITKPPRSRLINQRFEKGKLFLEFG